MVNNCRGNLEFSETLPCGGELRITSQSWEIHYVALRPDKRYKQYCYSILGSDLSKYRKSLIGTWKKFQILETKHQCSDVVKFEEKLDQSLSLGQLFEGEDGMYISIGYAALNGVSFQLQDHTRVKSLDDLKRVLKGWQYAEKKARIMLQFLQKVEEKIIKIDSQIKLEE